MDKEKFQFRGNSLVLSELKFELKKNYSEVYNFLDKFLNEDPFFELSTSGSTGRPKSIRLEKSKMMASAKMTLSFLKIPKKAKVLMCLPPGKIGGIMVLVRWLVGDLDLYLSHPKANPLKEFDIEFDFASMVPFQVQKSLGDISKIKKLIIGGAPLNVELEENLAGVDIEAYHSYGMTETISHIALRRVAKFAAFETLPNIKIEVDSNSCLIIDAPHLGVYKMKTKDIVQITKFNQFIWQGRLDNVINSGGLKFYPEEIEKKIGLLDSDFFITGIPNLELGEKLVLLLEGESKEKPSFSMLSKYETPKEIIVIPEFFRTTTGKVKRKETLEGYLKNDK